MKYIEYCEKKEHGTKEFPCECYHVTDEHPRYGMVYHWHNECELILVREGSFRLNADSKECILRKGDCASAVLYTAASLTTAFTIALFLMRQHF